MELNYQCIQCELLEGKYYNQNDQSSYNSQKICLACKNEKYCISCKKPYSLINNQCVFAEIEKYYASNNFECLKLCKCSISYNYQCLSCLQQCEMQTLTNRKRKLTNCSNCNICSQSTENGVTYDKCTQCDYQYFVNPLNESECILCDQEGSFQNTQNGKCEQCHITCKSCQTYSNCLSCYDNKYYIYNEMCICRNSSQDYENCTTCSNQCQLCSNSQVCTQCADNYYLLQIDQNQIKCDQCDSSVGKFIDGSYCKYCQTGCLLCSSLDSCQTCDINNSYYPYLDQEGKIQCSQCNTSGFTLIDNSCYKCDQNCYSCDATSKCTSCNELYFKLTINDVSQCVLCDQIGQMKSKNGLNCIQCSENCIECIDNNTCTICDGSYYLVPSGVSQICITCIMQDGYYLYDSTCIICNKNCKNCDETNKCLGCVDSYYKVANFDYCSLCDQPEEQLQNNSCIVCDSNCEVCVAGQCQQCKANYYSLNQNNIISCVPCTGANQYINSPNCFQCNSNCKTCDDTNLCLTCSLSYYLLTQGNVNSCVECNQPGQSIEDYTCITCPEYCKTCTQLVCDSCLEGKYLLLDPSTGYNSCTPCDMPGYSIDSQVCYQCNQNCKSCSSTNKCLDCLDSYYLMYLLGENLCVTGCLTGYYLSENQKACLECKQECASCDNGNSCLQCKENFYFNEDNHQCEVCTSEGYYKQDIYCKKCNSNCKTCNETDLCQACLSGYYKISLNGIVQCVLCNQEGQQIDGDSCFLCNEGCSTCDKANLCYTCKANLYLFQSTKCIPCNTSGYYINGQSCVQCNTNCATCDQSSLCLTCNSNYYLLQKKNGQKQCTSCTDQGFYINQINQTCNECNPGCICTQNNLCQSCKTGLVFTAGSKCVLPPEQACYSTCLECIGTASTDCISCKNNLFLQEDSSCGTCDQENGFYLLSNYCLKCHPSCKKCNGQQENNCTECYITQLKTSDNKCVPCPNNHFYQDNSSGICKPCHTDCLTCNGSSNQECIVCDQGKYKDLSSNLCITCNIDNNYFIKDNYCRKCDQSCNQCTGLTNKDCVNCRLGYENLVNDGCQICYPSSSLQSQINLLKKRCLKSSNQCIFNIKSNKFEHSLVCSQCQPDYLLSQNTCILSCSEVGDRFIFDDFTGTCVCPPSYPFYHFVDEKYQFCQNEQLPGYFCLQDKLCYQCSQNCQVCSDQSSCKQCFQSYNLWQNNCIDSCSSDQNLQVDQQNQSCKCKDDHFYRAASKMCIQVLKVVQISQAVNEKYNQIIFNLNRAPFDSELQQLNLLIDQQTLKQGVDYKILNYKIENNLLIFEVEVSQNRRVSQFNLFLNQINYKFQLKNTILTTESLNKNQQTSQGVVQSMNSISQFLTTKEGSQKDIITFLKNFQILCLFSNFVQLYGPIVLFKGRIPPQIEMGSILGASFVFKSAPTTQNVMVQSTSIEQTQIEINQEQEIFDNLGLTTNIYKDFLFPHLALQISIIISVLCILCRKFIKGEQNTIKILNKIINLMSSLQQGYITPTLFSIYYSIKYTTDNSLAIEQLIMHIIFILILSAMNMKYEGSYIEKNTPNFILNINWKAKGWRSYLILSYLKKYLCIMLILTFNNQPKIISIIISVIFILFSAYLAYFRFFSHCFFSLYKSFYELLIGISFIMLSVCIHKYEKLLSQNVLSDEELNSMDILSLIILLMFSLCLIASTILFVIRAGISSYNLLQSLFKYLRERKLKKQSQQSGILEIENITDSLQITTITMKPFLKRYQTKKFSKKYSNQSFQGEQNPQSSF